MVKERLAIMFCTSFTHEKFKSLVIRKGKKHDSSKNVKITSFFVPYKSNRKAWMTYIIFSQWLENISEIMKREGTKILLFVDNVS